MTQYLVTVFTRCTCHIPVNAHAMSNTEQDQQPQLPVGNELLMIRAQV